ncbi:MAG: glutaredoxin family protein [Planctomycetota bacterium]
MDHDPVRVVLYTIPGQCPLCDVAREALEATVPGAYREVDIRTDRALLRAYREEIPVVTVDGAKTFVGKVDCTELSRMIEKVRNGSETDPPGSP